MKNLIYPIFSLAFLIYSDAMSQKPAIELTFTATYQAQSVILDSLVVENVSQGGDTTLYAPITVLVLDFTTGVSSNPSLSERSFSVSQNRPNPFAEQTSIGIFLPEADHLKVSVINMLGQQCAFFESDLEAGSHLFTFYPEDQKYYFLSATTKGITKAIKMVCLNNQKASTGTLVYQSNDKTSASNKSGLEVNDFGYSLGDQLRFIGFAKNPFDVAGSDVIEAAPNGNDSYVFEIIEGIPCTGIPTVNYDGITYTTVQINNQCWFKENLNVGTMINTSNNQTNNSTIEKYCYEDEAANCDEYGGLYQWNEMMQYTTQQGAQGICPPSGGWHLPTNAEVIALTDYLGGEDVACGKMKETGTLHWSEPNAFATNLSGFTALPGGYFDPDYGFSWPSLTFYGSYWTSTESDADNAWERDLGYEDAFIIPYEYLKSAGMSVRCVKVDAGLATVTTSAITNITQTAATSGGEVTEDGGAGVTARGVCWSTSPNPTITDSHTLDGTGIGSFVSNISGLSPNTPYYIRAYATNSVGTTYGNEVSFTTLLVSFTCGDVISYEGQNYNTVLINSQCWFKENLNVGTMINGGQNQTNNSIIEKYCYNNNASNCTTYGGLYQWNEMMQYSVTPGAQGICPSDWHLPTQTDLNNLITSLGGTSVAGGKIKETGTLHWNPPNNATNSSGFTAFGGGMRAAGSFYSLKDEGYFWTSSPSSTSNAYTVVLYNTETEASMDNFQKANGNSVRCIKD